MHPFATLELLRVLDRTGGQFPEGTDATTDGSAQGADLQSVRHRLEVALGVELECETGSLIQDASFFASLILPPELMVVPVPPRHERTINFSNFGRLVAIGGEREVGPGAVATIRAILASANYCWVPAILHELPYDGVCSDDAGPIADWYGRFFTWGYPEVPPPA